MFAYGAFAFASGAFAGGLMGRFGFRSVRIRSLRISGVKGLVLGGEFITVLYPGDKTPEIEAVDGGVRVGGDVITFGGGIDDIDAEAYVNVARNRKAVMTLTGKDIDMDRFQGEVGLFVPDAGYPFGVIPDWLIRQRIKVPDWESDRVKAMHAGQRK